MTVTVLNNEREARAYLASFGVKAWRTLYALERGEMSKEEAARALRVDVDSVGLMQDAAAAVTKEHVESVRYARAS